MLGRNKTLVERFDGTSWTIQSSPNPPATTSSPLSAVSCATKRYCNAVGRATASGNNQTLVVSFPNWAIVTSPNASGAARSQLNGVSCVSAKNCWAVGSAVVSGVTLTLIEHWNGTSWTVVSSELEVKGTVPGGDAAKFAQAAEGAKDNCPISRALKGNVKLSVKATLA